MKTLITNKDCCDEWYQDTYICNECGIEFMTYEHEVPKFCPRCGVKFDALRIRDHNWEHKSVDIETIFLNDDSITESVNE